MSYDGNSRLPMLTTALCSRCIFILSLWASGSGLFAESVKFEDLHRLSPFFRSNLRLRFFGYSSVDIELRSDGSDPLGYCMDFRVCANKLVDKEAFRRAFYVVSDPHASRHVFDILI